MESLFWNVWGSKGAEKKLEISRFLKLHKPSFVSFLETKLDTSGQEVLKRKLNNLNSSFLSSEGRIYIFWNIELVEVEVLEHSSQHVHCSVFCQSTQRTFLVTSIYASNLFSERRLLWGIITRLSFLIQDSPWIVGGDFNEVRFSSEKTGGHPFYARSLRKFNSCIEASSLQDIKAFGHILSWNNRQEPRIMCRLDRVLVNSPFLNIFPHSMVRDPSNTSRCGRLIHLPQMLFIGLGK